MGYHVVHFYVILPYVVISEAVRELRKTLGESQQAFSNRLGLSLSSVAHYEGAVRQSPDFAVILMLFRVAAEVGRKDLAAFFLQAINADRAARVMVPVESEDERSKIRALQSILHDPQFSNLRKPLLKLLAPVEAQLQQTAALERVEAADIPAVARQMIKAQQKQSEQRMADAFRKDKKRKERRSNTSPSAASPPSATVFSLAAMKTASASKSSNAAFRP